MPADMVQLKETLELLARPRIALTATPGELTLRVLSARDPSVALLAYSIKPLVDDLAPYEASIIKGFSALSELIALLLDRTDMRTVDPLRFKQDVFNRGILMNQHKLIDALDFTLVQLEGDRSWWLNG